MRLRPRQYLLIALIVALGVYNLWRFKHPTPAPVVAPQRSTDSNPAVVAAWFSFDHAASLRDAPAPDFHAALVSLSASIDMLPNGNAHADLEACRLWLNSYRDGTVTGPGGRDKATQHVDRCVQLHRDAAI